MSPNIATVSILSQSNLLHLPTVPLLPLAKANTPQDASSSSSCCCCVARTRAGASSSSTSGRRADAVVTCILFDAIVAKGTICFFI